LLIHLLLNHSPPLLLGKEEFPLSDKDRAAAIDPINQPTTCLLLFLFLLLLLFLVQLNQPTKKKGDIAQFCG